MISYEAELWSASLTTNITRSRPVLALSNHHLLLLVPEAHQAIAHVVAPEIVGIHYHSLFNRQDYFQSQRDPELVQTTNMQTFEEVRTARVKHPRKKGWIQLYQSLPSKGGKEQ